MTDMSQVSNAAWIALAWLAGPALVLSLTVGLAVSLFQAMTQLQESTLSFAPKFIALSVLIALAGTAMFHGVTQFATALFHSVPELIRG
ncbi:MAG TPA: flagellar biosynthetic protein FliQ [Gammaproteobacteria bacterium]|nr:flagellar biosynthetic protein FliQ [Gammaproteobacteria bacterium]